MDGESSPITKGASDLTCLGDEYRVTMLKSMRPRRTYTPAEYTPAEKVMLQRDSTMKDVADFVAEYITSDVSNSVLLVCECVGLTLHAYNYSL